MKPMLAPSVAPSAGSIGATPAACATAMATGTIMLADAVFDVASDSRIAAPVKITVSASDDCDGSHAVMPLPMRVGQAGRKRQRAQRQPAAVQQHDAPVDAHGFVPGQREPPCPPVDRQHEQQQRAEHRRDAFGHGLLILSRERGAVQAGHREKSRQRPQQHGHAEGRPARCAGRRERAQLAQLGAHQVRAALRPSRTPRAVVTDEQRHQAPQTGSAPAARRSPSR